MNKDNGFAPSAQDNERKKNIEAFLALLEGMSDEQRRAALAQLETIYFLDQQSRL